MTPVKKPVLSIAEQRINAFAKKVDTTETIIIKALTGIIGDVKKKSAAKILSCSKLSPDQELINALHAQPASIPTGVIRLRLPLLRGKKK